MSKRTNCRRGHPFDEANTYVRPSDGARMCRTCNREHSRRRYRQIRLRAKPKTCGHCGVVTVCEEVFNGTPRCPSCAVYRRKRGVEPSPLLLKRRRARAQGKKYCLGCDRTLPPEHFYRAAQWRQSRCRDCQRQSHAQWKRANPEGYRQSIRRQVESGSNRENWQRRRARKHNAYVAPVNRLAIFERDRWRCGICGRKVSKKRKHPDPLSAVLDHIIPLAVGGTHEPANVQCAHARCNWSKSSRGGGEQIRLIG